MSSELIEGSGAITETQSPAAALAATKPNLPLLGLLALGHMVIDINGGAIAALLPFLKSALSLTYASSAAVILAANVTSSLVQPLFGYFADQTTRRWILPVSVFLASVGVALTGFAGSYTILLGLILISGLGIASYHPEGYRTATQVAGDRKA